MVAELRVGLEILCADSAFPPELFWPLPRHLVTMLVVDVVEERLLRQANELHPICPGAEEAFEHL